jgi:RNA polymerase sigma-70 factor (ECF subfamily)
MLPERPAAVLAVVYLIFNEGYGGRGELAAEALRLGTALVELMPDEAEVHGLHALMLLNDARREARFEGGELVLLGDQNRSRWDVAQTARGREALDRAFALPGGGPYTIQAAIASMHMEEPHDWRQIAALCGELVRLPGSPVVELNRAIAVAEADGAEPALALVDRLEQPSCSPPVAATRCESRARLIPPTRTATSTRRAPCCPGRMRPSPARPSRSGWTPRPDVLDEQRRRSVPYRAFYSSS